MNDKNRPSAKRMRDSSPWDIAAELGIQFTGDMNPFDHGGCFYETANWKWYGYASCVRFTPLEAGVTLVECATINHPGDKAHGGMARCLEYIGADADSTDVCQQIEAALAYWGAEVDEDLSGRYATEFLSEQESLAWRKYRPHILRLAEE